MHYTETSFRHMDPTVMVAILVIGIAMSCLLIASIWRIFTKAGKPGWAAIVPVYNPIVLLEIVKKPWWWILLMLVPVVNIVIIILVYIELSKAFGKPPIFALGLVLANIVFFPILGFGSARYQWGADAPAKPGEPIDRF